MNSQLSSLSKIFTEQLFRIPDYQRGYAWTDKHIKDFWNDLVQLPNDKNHYTGVLTLENVPEPVQNEWRDDLWIIKSKSFAPFYVVDGQQRLTTAIILIQTILESIPYSSKLNYNTLEEIRKRFIFDSKDDGISRSYIFGYEKDNPSYEFLKTRVFMEKSDESFPIQETIYTQNLDNAKKYFTEKLHNLNISEIENIYKKLTQHFLFNIYTISEEIDTFVTFETMNNRGKLLSHLELLKNRLIYLSTKFNAQDYEKSKLRNAINECWKSMYHYLGKNKNRPLNDDTFLFSHFAIRFGDEIDPRRLRFHNDGWRNMNGGTDYQEYLLEKEFTLGNIGVNDCDQDNTKLKIADIYSYVQSLKDSVEIWYQLLTPSDSNFTEDEKYWLDKLNRIGIISTAPLIMILFQNETSPKVRLRFLKSIERILYFKSVMRHVYNFSIDIHKMCQSLTKNETTAEKIIKELDDIVDEILNSPQFVPQVLVAEFRNSGFYQWPGIRYFLYEYELDLQEHSKAYRAKLNWDILNEEAIQIDTEIDDDRTEDSRDYHTIEHIYPQRPRKGCWTNVFQKYTDKEKSSLRNSLGNLVPLSQPKNSSFQNNCFEDKKGKEGSTIGFLYGSYSENEIAAYEKWTAKEIAERGIKLLKFMERRWRLKLGDDMDMLRILGVDFVPTRENSAPTPILLTDKTKRVIKNRNKVHGL